MYVVVVEFTIKADYVEHFRDRVRRQARDSLEHEADCQVFDVCIDPERTDYLLLYEVYSNAEAFDSHLAAAHFIDFDATVGGWVSSKRVTFLQRI